MTHKVSGPCVFDDHHDCPVTGDHYTHTCTKCDVAVVDLIAWARQSGNKAAAESMEAGAKKRLKK